MADTDIQFIEVCKHFDEVVAVDRMDLVISRGAFFSFLGPSGCGKTTSLRMIAGFEQPTAGDVLLEGRSVVGIPAYRRPVNMVFQHYALFPHMNVFDNIAYGLRQRRPRPDGAEIARRVGETLELVRLAGFERRKTFELSGGQQQRVALARALINRPTVLLLDEPLAALDRKLRRDMQIELQSLQREVGITFVLVTHDQEEALSMSDTVCIMRDGRAIQMGSPRLLYDEPANQYVADFVGKTNFIGGRVGGADEAGATLTTVAGRAFHGRWSRHGPRLGNGEEAVLAIRPELIEIAAPGALPVENGGVALEGVVRNRIFLGEQTEYLVQIDGIGGMLVLTPKIVERVSGGFEPGSTVAIGWRGDAALILQGV